MVEKKLKTSAEGPINEALFDAVSKTVYGHLIVLATQPEDEKHKLPMLRATVADSQTQTNLAHIESRRDEHTIDVMISFTL